MTNDQHVNDNVIATVDIEPMRQHIIKALQGGICEVTFNKVNGERRVMPCTLKEELLPLRNQKALTQEMSKESKTDAIAVWCTDADGWRSFKLSNFISINPLYD